MVKVYFWFAQTEDGRSWNETLSINEEFAEYFNGSGSMPWQNDLSSLILWAEYAIYRK